MKKQSDLYIFKQLPPEMLEKVRNFAIRLLIERAKNSAPVLRNYYKNPLKGKEATDDKI
jgi:hypothetical protein